MNIHKRTQWTLLQREEFYLKHHREPIRVGESGASPFCGAVSEKWHRAEIHAPGDTQDQWQGGTGHTNLDGAMAPR